MDWSNEEYVRLYTRDTTDDLELSWEALALWRAMLCKFDRSGVIAARNGWSSVAKAARMPIEVVVRVGPELIADGRVREVAGGFVAPNFVEAQTTSKSDRVRQRESRDRRRHDAVNYVPPATGAQASEAPLQDAGNTSACHAVSHDVTPGHTPSQNVTLSLASLSVAMAPEEPRPPPAPQKKERTKGKQPVPADWTPPEPLTSGGREQLARFRDHHRSKGNVFADVAAAWRNWQRKAIEYSQGQTTVSRRAPLPASDEPDLSGLMCVEAPS